MSRTLLEFKNISKVYSGNQVLKDVSFDIREGEIHALLGENGAGKSTIMNILFGMPVIHTTGGFDGEIKLNGEKVDINSPFDAMARGIGMVHQEFMLIPGFTIAENVKLNREILKDSALKNFVNRINNSKLAHRIKNRRSKSNKKVRLNENDVVVTSNNVVVRFFKRIFSRIYNDGIVASIFGKRMKTLDRKQMNKDARNALDKLDMSIEEFTLVQGLPIGFMQFVEIAREIDKEGLKVLVLDEPTAVLTESEAEHLLNAMRNIAALGIAIVFISHRLNEITAVSDRVTILRDGELVITKDTKDTTVLEIAEYMVGRQVSIDRASSETRQFNDDDIALSVKDLYVAMPNEQVKGISFDVRRGEIFGIGGLAGQGKLGIANGLMGLYESKGDVSINGIKITLGKTRQMLGTGAAFVSEDRKGVGLLIEESIEDNIVFTAMNLHSEFLNKIGLSNKHAIREHAKRMIKDLDIRCTSEKQHTGRLSGGNQQKVCVARALTQKPTVLFVSEPTRGIDIGAKKLILDLLLELSREQGMTIIMTSSELAELCSISDRVAMICEGKMVGVLPPDASPAKFSLMMAGITDDEGEVTV